MLKELLALFGLLVSISYCQIFNCSQCVRGPFCVGGCFSAFDQLSIRCNGNIIGSSEQSTVFPVIINNIPGCSDANFNQIAHVIVENFAIKSIPANSLKLNAFKTQINIFNITSLDQIDARAFVDLNTMITGITIQQTGLTKLPVDAFLALNYCQVQFYAKISNTSKSHL